MKKTITIVLAAGLIISVTGAATAKTYGYVNQSTGAYSANKIQNGFSQKSAQQPSEKWYVAVRAGINGLTFENESKFMGVTGVDKYSFNTMYTKNASFGKSFGNSWRAELEVGHMGSFKDSQGGIDFNISVPYITANNMYDFENGLYVGAGLGVAMPTVSMDSLYFIEKDREEMTFAPMGSLMFGYSYKLDDRLILDLRYRFAASTGYKYERKLEDLSTPVTIYKLENKSDLLMNNSFTVGLRYEF